MKGWFHKLIQVGGWPSSKILRIYVSTQMARCFIGKIKFIEHVLVRSKIKNPVTKLNASCSITGLQFVTYAKFIQIRNTYHSVGRRVWNTNTLSKLMRRDGGMVDNLPLTSSTKSGVRTQSCPVFWRSEIWLCSSTWSTIHLIWIF